MIQVGWCTPFVTEVMGTSCTGSLGQRFWNISCETARCRTLTALRNADVFSASTAMEKRSELSCILVRPKRQKSFEREAGPVAVVVEMFVEQAGIEQVDAGRHGGVSGEDVAYPGRLKGLIEGQTVFLHKNTDAFYSEEGGVALVHMVHGGFNSDLCERAQAADAENNFLTNALENIAAVELVGDFAMFHRAVLRDVGIQNVQS